MDTRGSMHMSEVWSKTRKKNIGWGLRPGASSTGLRYKQAGRLCHSDNLPPSILEDDYFAIHNLSGIQALDICGVQRIHFNLN